MSATSRLPAVFIAVALSLGLVGLVGLVGLSWARPAWGQPDPDPAASAAPASSPAPVEPLGVAVGGLWLRPSGLLEGDVRAYPSLPQGTSGFALGRGRLGVTATSAHTFTTVTAELVGDRVTLLNAFISYSPWRWLELSIGFRKSPLFITGRDLYAPALPLMERSATVRALWPLRDLGAEVVWRSEQAPIDLFLRASNGSAGWVANDDDLLALTARLDLALGRARDPSAPFGLRVGGAVIYEDVLDRPGMAGQTPWGFAFQRVPSVSGERLVLAGHLRADLGPVSLIAEGGWAREGRARDTDGDPNTPRVPQDPMRAGGVSAEVWWTVWGPWRRQNLWPISQDAPPGGAVEVAARFERLWVGQGTSQVTGGGALGGAISTRWWISEAFAVGASGHYYDLDQPPVDDPSATSSWLVMGRVTAHLGERPANDRPYP